MTILNERPSGMSLINYHSEQKAYQSWLKRYKQGRLVYLAVEEKRKNGITIGRKTFDAFVGRGQAKTLAYV